MPRYHVPIENHDAPLAQRWTVATYDVADMSDAIECARLDFERFATGPRLTIWAPMRLVPSPADMQYLRDGFDRSGMKPDKQRRNRDGAPALGKLRPARMGGGQVYA